MSKFLTELREVALSTRSQSFVSIEAWELLTLIEIAEAAENAYRYCWIDDQQPLVEYLGKRLKEVIDGK